MKALRASLPGVELIALDLEVQVLATRPPQKSQSSFLQFTLLTREIASQGP